MRVTGCIFRGMTSFFERSKNQYDLAMPLLKPGWEAYPIEKSSVTPRLKRFL